MHRIHVAHPLEQLFDVLGKSIRDDLNLKPEVTQWNPKVNLQSGPDAFYVFVDLPGVDVQTVDIQISKNVLTIKGEREPQALVDGGKWDRQDAPQGTFSRQFNLPETVDQQGIVASSENGVLKVTLPKKAEAAPIKVEVR